MSDLHRLAHRLVTVLSVRDRPALAGPLALTDIAERVLPYRACRRVLELDSAEDYDLLLLRLAAEEEGLARTFPPDAADRCRREVSAGNPDLTLLQRLEGVTVRLNLQAIGERDHSATPDASEAGGDSGEPAPLGLTPEFPIAIRESVTEAEPLPAQEADQAGGGAPGPEPEPDPEPELEQEPEPEREPERDPVPNPPAGPESEDLLADHLELGPELESSGAGFAEPTDSEIEPPASALVVYGEPVEEATDSWQRDAEDPTDPEPVAAEDSAPVQRLSAELESLLALAAEFADERDAPAEELFVGSRTPPAVSHPAPPRCHDCAGSLPVGRPVRFCPHCGRNLVPLQCIRCRADLEPEWRHCVLCGHPTGDDSRFA